MKPKKKVLIDTDVLRWLYQTLLLDGSIGSDTCWYGDCARESLMKGLGIKSSDAPDSDYEKDRAVVNAIVLNPEELKAYKNRPTKNALERRTLHESHRHLTDLYVQAIEDRKPDYIVNGIRATLEGLTAMIDPGSTTRGIRNRYSRLTKHLVAHRKPRRKK